MRVVPLSLENAPAWEALFEACATSCFCRYWHFDGNKNEWLARCAHDPGKNLAEGLEGLRRGDDAARGLVALEGDAVVGWMKLCPKEEMRKLTRLGVYRSEPSQEAGVLVIGCLLVRPDRRRQGVARALVDAADAHVRAWGGSSIEAYPRHFEGPLHDEEAWMGPEKVFADAGYERVGGEGPYPVYRKMLNGEAIV
jgi:GNAT superfamily N-acetyltransferase